MDNTSPVVLPEVVIQFSPVFCTLDTDIGDDLQEELYNTLAYRSEGYFFSPRYQSGMWDGFVRLYQPQHNRFRSGLLSRVITFLSSRSLTPRVIGQPGGTVFTPRESTYTLREYQERAVVSILISRFGIVQSPPRSGKTLLAIAVADSERSFPLIFFCRSLDLAYQTKKRFQQFLPSVSVGIVGDGLVELGDVTAVTIQSAYSAYGKSLKEPDLVPEKQVADRAAVRGLIESSRSIFYDEVHHSQSKTSRFILDKAVNATLKIGLSATPFSGKGEDLLVEEAIGPVIHQVGYSELIQQGFLLRPTIYMYKLPKHAADGSYQSVYKKAVTENVFLEQLIKRIVDSLVAKHKSVVIQTEFINHSRRLGKLLNCEVLTGGDSTERRASIIQQLQERKLPCIVSTLFEEGLDVPTLDYTINVAGGLSNISTLQRMRSLTASAGKATCGVIDFFHQCKYLKRHSKVRKEAYTKEPEFIFTERDVSTMTFDNLAL